MLLQNLHRRYLYIIIKLPHIRLRIENTRLSNCDNYGSLHASNPEPLLDDTPTNDRLSVIILKLIIFDKWMLLLNYEID